MHKMSLSENELGSQCDEVEADHAAGARNSLSSLITNASRRDLGDAKTFLRHNGKPLGPLMLVVCTYVDIY